MTEHVHMFRERRRWFRKSYWYCVFCGVVPPEKAEEADRG